jgi:hypothetical protein
MRTIRRTLLVLLAGVLTAACALSLPEGDTRPSAANQPLGGPPTGDPSLETGTRVFGFDIFSGFRTRE